MSVTDFFVFRHGETDWNKERRLQGHTDIPLNEEGKIQAEELAKKLCHINLDAIVTSDLSRAKVTAEIVNLNLKLPFFEATELRECSLGDSEGMYRDNLITNYGEAYWDKWLSIEVEDQDFSFPNGESKSAHIKRLINFLEMFAKSHASFKKVAISTHGGSLRRLVHYCKNSPKKAVPLPNCALYQISYNHVSGQWLFVADLNMPIN